MFPLMLDLSLVPAILVGNGHAAARRLALLEADAPGNLSVYADAPGAELEMAAGGRLIRRLPHGEEIARAGLLFVVDMPRPVAARLAAAARRRKVLVNVEDDPPLCDFHSPAMVRRGDLLLTVSTNGRSPGLARRLRLLFEETFPRHWAERLDRIAASRDRLRAEGADMGRVMHETDALIDREGWLPRKTVLSE